MKTHSSITSRVTLNSSIEETSSFMSGVNGSFAIKAFNTQGPNNITTLSQPASSILTLESITTHSPNTVSLSPGYEGAFELITARSNSRVVGVDAQPEDPSGKDRDRQVSINEVIAGLVKGTVAWVDTGDVAEYVGGSVKVINANAINTLNLV
jgi:hypothetical protein